MNITPPAGEITIAGKSVSRLGIGTMRLTGPGTWCDPPDRKSAIDLLRRAVCAHGITHIDTADAYGPHTVEQLIREALHPYPTDLLIATKVGMVRPAPDVWSPLGRPEYLRAAVEASLYRLGVDQLDLCYLHRIDPEVALADQIGTLRALQKEGKIVHIGLSKVTAEEIRMASVQITIAAVQNAFNMRDRDDPVLEYCRDHGIPYVPYRPLDAGHLAQPACRIAALQWLLNCGNHVALIPGTSSIDHLDDLVLAVADAGPGL